MFADISIKALLFPDGLNVQVCGVYALNCVVSIEQILKMSQKLFYLSLGIVIKYSTPFALTLIVE